MKPYTRGGLVLERHVRRMNPRRRKKCRRWLKSNDYTPLDYLAAHAPPINAAPVRLLAGQPEGEQ